MSKVSKIDQIHLRAVMLCMSKMSKMSKIHQIHLRAVMLCMSKMSKMGKEHTHTFWFITSLIINGFSIRKKFWKAETESFPTIPSNLMYVEACRRCQRLCIMHIITSIERFFFFEMCDFFFVWGKKKNFLNFFCRKKLYN